MQDGGGWCNSLQVCLRSALKYALAAAASGPVNQQECENVFGLRLVHSDSEMLRCSCADTQPYALRSVAERSTRLDQLQFKIRQSRLGTSTRFTFKLTHVATCVEPLTEKSTLLQSLDQRNLSIFSYLNFKSFQSFKIYLKNKYH